MTWRGAAPAAEYLFLQQVNDLCMLAPMVSLHRLEALLAAYGSLPAVPDREWRTRRQWFGKEVRYLDAWYRAIERVNHPDTAEIVELRRYAAQALAEAPVTPHFYDAAGRHYFSGEAAPRFGLRSLRRLVDFAMTPFLFIDLPAFAAVRVPFAGQLLPRMGIQIPICRARRGAPLQVFNQDTEAYEPLLSEPAGAALDLRAARTARGGLDSAAYAGLSRWGEVRLEAPAGRTLGFATIARAPRFGRGMLLDAAAAVPYAPYMAGLYKLMLHTAGVDERNQDLTPDHPLHRAHLGLRAVHDEEPEWNPWSARYLRKEAFLQHQVAALLIDDPALRLQAEAAVDFSAYAPYRAYTGFLQAVADGRVYRDRAGRSPYTLAQVTPYLPGPEQQLSLALTNLLRLLWYGTLDEAAFHRYTAPRIGLLLSPLTGGFRWTFAAFAAAAQRRVGGPSFVEVWQQLRARLRRRPRRHFFSFDYHGWVVSLDDQLIALQRASMQRAGWPRRVLGARLALLEALGVTGIDSSHSRRLSSFYKRAGTSRP